jgi:hypothetical protein
MRTIAIGLVLVVIALAVLGSPLTRGRRIRWGFSAVEGVARLTWIAAMAPWRLAREPVDLKAAMAVSLLALVTVGVLAGTLTGFATPWIGGGAVFIFAVVGLAFESSVHSDSRAHGRGRLLVATVGPLLPGVIALLALIAYLSPLGFWYGFWTSPVVRAAFVTIIIATPLWTAYVLFAVRVLDGWRAIIAGWLTASGTGLLAAVMLMPEWQVALRSLDRPLNLAPATDTMLFALQTYVGVRLQFNGLVSVGALLLAAGFLMQLRTQRRAPETASIGR